MVGQFENSLMPWRTEGSERTSIPLNLTPRWLRICTTAAENPHCGKTGVPFMKSTTGASAIWSRIRSFTVLSILSSLLASAVKSAGCSKSFPLIVRRAGLQGERVQLVAHPALQRLVHELMLLYPAFVAEGARHDVRGVMVAVAAEILDRDPGVGQAF